MITEYIRYRVADDATAGFESAYATAAESLAAAPQCLGYQLARCVDEPACYILRITWTSAADHLDGFRKGEHFPPFFAAIRPYVDQIEEMRHYEPTAVAGDGGATPTLYAWAGGEEALRRLFTAFYGHVLDDELIGPLFAHMDPHHPDHVATWLTEVFGGPDRYTREHGGYPHMLAQHLGRGITEAQRRRWVSLLHDAADEVGLPDDPEFRAAFAAYIEWGDAPGRGQLPARGRAHAGRTGAPLGLGRGAALEGLTVRAQVSWRRRPRRHSRRRPRGCSG